MSGTLIQFRNFPHLHTLWLNMNQYSGTVSHMEGLYNLTWLAMVCSLCCLASFSLHLCL